MGSRGGVADAPGEEGEDAAEQAALHRLVAGRPRGLDRHDEHHRPRHARVLRVRAGVPDVRADGDGTECADERATSPGMKVCVLPRIAPRTGEPREWPAM